MRLVPDQFLIDVQELIDIIAENYVETDEDAALINDIRWELATQRDAGDLRP